MPIPKYRCRECGKEFAKILIDLDNAPRHCPVCGAPEPEELGPAFEYTIRGTLRLSCASCNSCEEKSQAAGCAVT